MEYLLGKKSILPYRILWVIAVFVGAVVSVPFVWDFADATNALMAIPNVIALLLLSGVIVAETRKYLGPANIDLVADDFLDQVDTRTKISRSQCAAQKQ
jgi:AGCS family alanine or glycine:cation symporter